MQQLHRFDYLHPRTAEIVDDYFPNHENVQDAVCAQGAHWGFPRVMLVRRSGTKRWRVFLKVERRGVADYIEEGAK